jgi:hypothetical protein
MRAALVGLLCLVLGGAAALGYSHYVGEGKELASVQAELLARSDDLEKAESASKQAKEENTALAAQVQQLSATKDDLKHQLDAAKAQAVEAPAVTAPSNSMAEMMKASVAQRYQAKLLLLTSRLHLTPDQVAAVKEAMDREADRATQMATKMFSGGKVDMSAAGTGKSVEQTLDDILTPDQKTTYQQIKTEEKTSSAEMVATMEMNPIAPMLQMSDTQKDQVYSALTQVQLDMQDPAWLKANVTNGAGNPMAVLDAQAKAKDDALAKILSPDQMATYRQQTAGQLALQKAMVQRFTPVTPAPTASAPSSTPAPAPAAAVSAPTATP